MRTASTNTNRNSALPEPRIALGIVSAWLALGSLALLSIPALRGTSEWFGWLPFWFVVAPLTDLLILRWRDVVGVSRKTFAHLRRRHRALRRAISRRLKQPRAVRRRLAQSQSGSLLTALLH